MSMQFIFIIRIDLGYLERRYTSNLLIKSHLIFMIPPAYKDVRERVQLPEFLHCLLRVRKSRIRQWEFLYFSRPL